MPFADVEAVGDFAECHAFKESAFHDFPNAFITNPRINQCRKLVVCQLAELVFHGFFFFDRITPVPWQMLHCLYPDLLVLPSFFTRVLVLVVTF
jgi:hypothetical protein